MSRQSSHWPSRAVAVAIAGSVAAGCSALPKQEALSQFGSATAKSEATFEFALATTRSLGTASDAEVNAVKYLDGKGFSLTPRQQVTLSPDAVAPPRALMRSIKRYAESLAAAADEGTIERLESAAGNLLASVGAAAGEAVPGGAALATPAASLVGRLFGRALAENYLREIEGIIRDVHPTLEEAAQLLKTDIGKFDTQLFIECRRFPEEKATTLIAVAEDGRISRREKLDLFKAAQAEVEERSAGCGSLQSFPKVLDKMVEAHAALLKTEGDAAAAVGLFVATVDDINSIILAQGSAE